MFGRRKSTWQKLAAPAADAAGRPPVRSALTGLATAVAVTLASAGVSALRRRDEAR
jgi:hypothetical protein